MVKKIKRFMVFCLFGMFYSLLGGKIAKQYHHRLPVIEENTAEAKCCPAGSVSLDRDGNCISSGGVIVDETCY